MPALVGGNAATSAAAATAGAAAVHSAMAKVGQLQEQGGWQQGGASAPPAPPGGPSQPPPCADDDPPRAAAPPATAAPAAAVAAPLDNELGVEVTFEPFVRESQMGPIVSMIEKDLSEPYSIFTYRYFIHGWPKLCYLAMVGGEMVGCIVCKASRGAGPDSAYAGYIAMLAVTTSYRKHGIGSKLVCRAIEEMIAMGCDECCLEAEITNEGALRLYERLGFMRTVRLIRYYLNGSDAYKLKLLLK
jgi:peptide alpha-N-acetyltransferase